MLDALEAVPRERFVPGPHRALAHEDRPLSIGHGATISQPRIVARMLQLARVGPADRVLDVGGGSGYAAAITARLAASVVSMELVPELAERASTTLVELGVTGVDVVVGDGWLGRPERAPFDVILVAAAAPGVPQALTEQLADGGRLVLPVGPPRHRQTLVRITRLGDMLHREDHGAVRFVPLVAPGAEAD